MRSARAAIAQNSPISISAGLQFLLSCPWHFTPHGIEARRLIQSGKLGQIKMIGVMMTNFTEGLYQGLTWDEVFGKNPTRQNAAQPYRAPGLASYSDPAVASGGPMPSDRQNEVRVYGTKGQILLELWKGKMEFHDDAFHVTRYPDIAEENIYPMFEPARNLVDSITGAAPNGSPATLGLYAMRIIEAAVQSARTGANVIVG